MLNKIYAGLGILAIILAGILYILHLRSSLKEEIRLKEDALFTAWAANEGQKLANQVSETLNKKQKAIRDENSKLRACIADGTCGVQLNAGCEKTTSNSLGTVHGLCRLDGAAEQGWLDLEEGIDTNKALYDSCLQTLENWKKLVENNKKD